MCQQGYETYYDLSQKVADAIYAAMGIDVTIMDERMVRIAGTGIYKAAINQKIEEKTAFDYCFKTGEHYIIEEPKKAPVCYECPKCSICNEKAEICVPISYKEKVIGVIGIIAFNELQKEKINLNKETYLNFTYKMASLLVGKYGEIQAEGEKNQLSLRLSSILNTMNEALIVFSPTGEILYENRAFQILLQEMGLSNTTEVLDQIRHDPGIINSLNQNSRDVDFNEVIVRNGEENFSLLASLSTLGGQNGKEIILTLQNIKRIQKKVIQSAERNQLKLEFQDILGFSSSLTEVKLIAKKAAHSDSNILIYGESGTGKELFARAIHNESRRNSYPFLPINCGAIPDELLESELFGYEKGAFTGAFNTKLGKFEVAEKGTIFLDEISEMPYRLQVKLLRVLQEKEVCRIGSNKIRKLDVRIISAANKDLQNMIKDSRFREDLYYRLNIIPIYIPPLRERREDIIFLAEHFIKYYSRLLNKDILELSSEVKKIILNYSWPGNVRELQNLIEYAVNLESGTSIGKELVLKRIDQAGDRLLPPEKKGETFGGCSLSSHVRAAERALLIYLIDHYMDERNKVKLICGELEISRATLYRKLKEHNLCLENETVSDLR